MTNRLLLLFAFASLASAHFVFVVPQPGAKTAQVFISEGLKPADEVDVAIIGQAKLTIRTADGRETPLVLKKGEHAFTADLSGAGLRVIHGAADLGLTAQGQQKPYLLVYYPKTIVGDAFDPSSTVGAAAPVEIVPAGQTGAVRLKVLAHGKLLANAEVTVILPDGAQKKLTTDAEGLTGPLTETGRYGAWVRYWEDAGGVRGGQAYSQTRNYATLVFDAPAARLATLPEAAASFGAVVSDGWLYVYGGHISATHSYSTASVSGRFSRLKLAPGAAWESLPGGPPLQGMNLAAYEGKIYRIGGMTPKNKPSEKSATFSVADCARFDPATMKWEPLPDLPEPRSSHDVAIVGGKLIVSGGWTLKGPSPTVWLDTVETLDLSGEKQAKDKLEWKSSKQPFRRRALIAAAYSGKMYLMGGFDEKAEVVQDVSIFDPSTAQWSKGPGLPGKDVDGFAPAACVHNGKLYVSIADGSLYRLNQSQDRWEKVGQATPRIAHRIVSAGKSILVLGGADKGRNLDLVESVPVEDLR